MKFYTYLHCKPNGDPFYVGKGCGNRAYTFLQRNPLHQNIVKHHGKENIGIYIFKCDSEKQAFLDEIQQIEQLRSEGYKLANFTDGGDGASGYSHTPEAKKKTGDARRGIPRSEETKAKLRIANLGNSYALGIKRTDEFIENIKVRMLGKKMSLESSVKKSLAAKGKKKPRTKEHQDKINAAVALAMQRPDVRLKLANANRGKKQSPELIAKRFAIIKENRLSKQEKML